MSDANAPVVKVKLSTLLEKATAIAGGADKSGLLPGTEGYDAESAPNGAMQWCAAILRVFLLRMIEHVIDTRNGINGIMSILKDPALKDGEKWRSDIPALREQVKEMSSLMGEIVKAIKEAQGGAQPQPQQEGAEAPANGEQSAEQVEAAQTQAQIDELAAQLAKGEKPDLENLVKTTPTAAPVVQIQQGGKRNRNPAGNEKV